MHNRKQVYKTTFSNANYCMFSPGYSYTDEEIQEIQAAADNACQEVSALVSEGADDYEKAKAVYTYLIDTAEYQESEDDQSMAGIFGGSRQCVPDMQGLPSICWNILECPVFTWKAVLPEVQRDMPGTLLL